MKKTFLLVVACVFAFVNAQAQNSEVEAVNQLTKAEQFMANNSLIKETQIYKFSESSQLKVFVKLFTCLESGEQIAALEFHPAGAAKFMFGAQPLGFLDMDQVDDLTLALEKMLNEHNNAEKKEKFTISYTAPGGIDAFYVQDYPNQITPVVLFRKKWYSVNEYGVQVCNYSSANALLPIKAVPDFLASLKEAQTIANQSLGK